MIDLANEQLIPLREAPKWIPARPSGKRVHISACYRWSSRGVRGVVLDTIKVGGSTYTSIEALQRFADELSSTRTNGKPRFRRTLSRTRQLDRATSKLETLLGKSEVGHSLNQDCKHDAEDACGAGPNRPSLAQTSEASRRRPIGRGAGRPADGLPEA